MVSANDPKESNHQSAEITIAPWDGSKRYFDEVAELAYSIEFPLVKKLIKPSDIRLLIAAPTGLYSHSHFKLALDRNNELLGILNTRLRKDDSPSFERAAFRRALGYWRYAALNLRSLVTRIDFFGDSAGANALHIEHIAAVQGKRGLGIGAALMDYALQEAKEAAADFVDLEVFRTNTGAQRFYIKHGFDYAPGSDPQTPLVNHGFWRHDDALSMQRRTQI
jgi:ribosomal protein S18 acetylase RimI-like enzyme